MQKQFQEAKLMQAYVRGCVTYGGPNCGERCVETVAEEEAKYMGQQAPYSNTYNQGWKNHPNLSWGDRGNNYQKPYNNQGFQGQGARSQEQSSGKKSLEELLENFLVQQEDANKKRDAVVRNLEHQVLPACQ